MTTRQHLDAMLFHSKELAKCNENFKLLYENLKEISVLDAHNYLVEFYKELPKSFTIQDLVDLELIHKSEDTTKRYLRSLKKIGLVGKTGTRYTVLKTSVV